MTMKEKFFTELDNVLTEVGSTIRKKNAGYAGSSINNPFYNFQFSSLLASTDLNPVTVEQGLLTRCGDKISRYKSLCENPDLPFEGKEDTLKDLIAYFAILYIWEKMDRPFLDHEYEEDVEPLKDDTKENIPSEEIPLLSKAGTNLANFFGWK